MEPQRMVQFMDISMIYTMVNHGTTHGHPPYKSWMNPWGTLRLTTVCVIAYPTGWPMLDAMASPWDNTTACLMARVGVRVRLRLSPWNTPLYACICTHPWLAPWYTSALGYSMVYTIDVHSICHDVFALPMACWMGIGCPMGSPIEHPINYPWHVSGGNLGHTTW